MRETLYKALIDMKMQRINRELSNLENLRLIRTQRAVSRSMDIRLSAGVHERELQLLRDLDRLKAHSRCAAFSVS
jgi:hypothetical protein